MNTLRSKEIFNDTRFRLVVVESVDIRHSKMINGGQLIGKIEPIALIVKDTNGVYALDIEANLTDLDKLRQKIPELQNKN